MEALTAVTKLYLWRSIIIGILSTVANYWIIVFFCTRTKEQRDAVMQVKLSMACANLLAGIISIVNIILLISPDIFDLLVFIIMSIEQYLVSVSLCHLIFLGLMALQSINQSSPMFHEDGEHKYITFIHTTSSSYGAFCAIAWFLPISSVLISSFVSFILDNVVFLPFWISSRILSVLILCLSFMPYLISAIILCCLLGKFLKQENYHRKNALRNQLSSSDDEAAMNNLVSEADSEAISTASQLLKQRRNTYRKIVKMIALIFFGYFITCFTPFIMGTYFIFHAMDSSYKERPIFYINIKYKYSFNEFRPIFGSYYNDINTDPAGNLRLALALLPLAHALVNFVVYLMLDIDFEKFVMWPFTFLFCRKYLSN